MKKRKCRMLTCSKHHKYFTLIAAWRFSKDLWLLFEAGLTLTCLSSNSQLPSSLGCSVFCCHRTVPTAWSAPSAVTAAMQTGATPPRATAAASQDGQVQETPLGSTKTEFPTSGTWFCGQRKICEVGRASGPCSVASLSPFWLMGGEVFQCDLLKTGSRKRNFKAWAPLRHNSLQKWWSAVNIQGCSGSFGVKHRAQELRKLCSGSQEEDEPLP